jgi:hypothetical protein
LLSPFSAAVGWKSGAGRPSSRPEALSRKAGHLRFITLCIALLLLLPALPARANFLWQEYGDWSYFQTSGWWLNCQIMTTGPRGFSISFKSQIDTESGAADSEFFLYSKDLSGIAGERGSLRVFLAFDGAEPQELTLDVDRPTKASLEIGPQWTLIKEFLWRGEAVLYEASGRKIDSFSLHGAQQGIDRWRACLGGDKV